MLYVLAIVCPPLAVLLVDGPARAAGNAALTSLLYFPGLLHAMTSVDHYRNERRNEALLDAVARYYAQ